MWSVNSEWISKWLIYACAQRYCWEKIWLQNVSKEIWCTRSKFHQIRMTQRGVIKKISQWEGIVISLPPLEAGRRINMHAVLWPCFVTLFCNTLYSKKSFRHFVKPCLKAETPLKDLTYWVVIRDAWRDFEIMNLFLDKILSMDLWHLKNMKVVLTLWTLDYVDCVPFSYIDSFHIVHNWAN